MPGKRSARLQGRALHPVEVAAQATPLYATVLAWVLERLQGHGYARPACKRVALLLVGLVGGERATPAGVAAAVHGLAITAATEESIARRLARLLDDERLDPERLVPALVGDLLPVLLRGLVAAHRANAAAGAFHHRRFLPLHLVVDESSVDDRVHILAIGLAYQGLVLPLGVRCWPQNVALPEGEYWTQVGGLLWQVRALLPPELRDHVLLLADRGYGVPRMIDLCRSLDWAWLLRVQGQTRVQVPDGPVLAVRELTPRPGLVWLGPAGAPAAEALGPTEQDEAARVFKAAGWRQGRLAAAWAVGQAEPWLLVTSLTTGAAQLRTYAERWAIERLFLAWKSHGWNLEGGGLRDPARLGRLLAGLVAATLWRVAFALPVAAAQLPALAARAGARPLAPRQLPLPWDPPPPDDLVLPAGTRPWAAKFSLLTWGAKVLARVDLRTTTPALCWELPAWEAPTWFQQCHRAAHASA
jgi:hypothetical protein